MIWLKSHLTLSAFYSLKVLFLILFISGNTDAGSQVPAFPGAEGFGKYARGGRGGEIIFVTNLNGSGPGSFKAACESTFPRTVIFRVGGQIVLSEDEKIKISSPFLTIAGETAPGDGIVITGDESITSSPITVQTHDVIIRNIRVRPGPGRAIDCTLNNGTSIDALVFSNGSKNCIVDHCSFSFTTDELASVWGNCDSITFQSCLMSHPLHYSTHYYNCDTTMNQPVDHGRGPLFGGSTKRPQHTTIYKCLMADATYRYPEIKYGVFQVVNNINYNYRSGITTTSEVKADIIGNYFIPGPETDTTRRREIYLSKAVENNPLVYVKDNIGQWRKDSAANEWDLASERDEKYRSLTPLTEVPPLLKAYDALREVPETAGAGALMSPSKRDAMDSLTLENLREEKGGYIDHPSEVWPGWPDMHFSSAPPYPDNDSDGMDDNWESVKGGDLSRNEYLVDDEGNYTNLECFLHELSSGNFITGLGSRSGRKIIKIFPNPVSDRVILDFLAEDLPAQLAIYSPLGWKIFSGKIFDVNPEIRMVNYQPGIYFLKVDTREGQYWFKIIKS